MYQSVLFDGAQTAQEVKLIVLNAGSTLHYQYQTIAFRSNGTQVQSDWKKSTNALLVLQTQALG